MPSHRITNDFIRKYNKLFQIKGWSKLKINEKIDLVEKRLSQIKGSDIDKIKKEWESVSDHKITKFEKQTPKTISKPIEHLLKKKGPEPVKVTHKPPSSSLKIKKPEHTLKKKGPAQVKVTHKPPSSSIKITKKPMRKDVLIEFIMKKMESRGQKISDETRDFSIERLEKLAKKMGFK
tara:strand:- start:744 stop:1277 length:534 start_codon:yes stop_codon:yes gene_type:complete